MGFLMDTISNWNKKNDEEDKLKGLLEKNDFDSNEDAVSTARQYEGLKAQTQDGFLSHAGDDWLGRMGQRTGMGNLGIEQRQSFMPEYQMNGQTLPAINSGIQQGNIDSLRGGYDPQAPYYSYETQGTPGGILDLFDSKDISGALNYTKDTGARSRQEEIFKMFMSMMG